MPANRGRIIKQVEYSILSFMLGYKVCEYHNDQFYCTYTKEECKGFSFIEATRFADNKRKYLIRINGACVKIIQSDSNEDETGREQP